MRNLALIPARGGSKRIPRKNIRLFCDKPIVSYAVEVALSSELFNEVMVSTDDEEIAKISRNFGASIPFMRSYKTADDHTPLAEVIEEVKQAYLSTGKEFDNICCILPTSPLITTGLLKETYELLLNKMADSVRPVVRYSYPIQRAMKMKEGVIEMIDPEHRMTRTQDLEPSFHDAGQFYWMRFEKGLKGTKRLGFEISEMQSQDIDTLEDWRLAELKYSLLFS